MKKYILLIVSLFVSLTSVVNANVDTTNVFNFTYDTDTCILNTDFDL
ncbi:MAG: hypothetical protein LBC61_04310 [Candidatus Peribacteria bacterium]|nr:hypothetical protein [Candidatus Peribacteria bacterium]